MIEYLTLEDLLVLIQDLGVGPIGDLGLLDSAAHRPQVTVMGVEAYDSLDTKAAVLLESLVRNHSLVDGKLPKQRPKKPKSLEYSRPDQDELDELRRDNKELRQLVSDQSAQVAELTEAVGKIVART